MQRPSIRTAVRAFTSRLDTRTAIAASLVMAALLLQQFAQFPLHNAFTSSLSNWMHVPMFVAITAVIMWLRPQQPLWMTLLAVAGIALLSEGLQLLTSRQASAADLLKDALGAGIALTLLRPVQPRLITAAVVTLMATMSVPGLYLAAYTHQKLSFPLLYSPDAVFTKLLTSVQGGANAQHHHIRNHAWAEYDRRTVLAVTWGDTRWPGVHFAEPVSNWQNYEQLRVDVFNRETTPQRLTVGVRHRGFEGTARYLPMQIQPGHNRLSIKLAHLALLADGTPASITHLMLYTNRQHAGERILLGQVWLQ